MADFCTELLRIVLLPVAVIMDFPSFVKREWELLHFEVEGKEN